MVKAKHLIVAMVGAASLAAGAAHADRAAIPGALARFAVADAVVLAIRSDFPAAGGHVRLTVYDSPATFLESPRTRVEGVVNEEGVALLPLRDLAPGDYSFVAYLDENGDGKLNLNVFGRPKEPFIFSNNIRPKLRKPTFDETKVQVALGEVIELTLKD